MKLTAAILAGGLSRRMGKDKASLRFGGMSLLERTARVCFQGQMPVVVVGRQRPAEWQLPEVVFIEDNSPDCGPLGGLQTALTHTNGPVLALACDMPLMTAAALRWLMLAFQQHEVADGVVVLNAQEAEPLFSIYTPSCLPLIEARLRERRLSLRGLIAAGQFERVQAPGWVAAQLVNINTPDDLARLALQSPRTDLS